MEGVWRCIAGVRFAQNSQFWGSSILRVSFFRIVFWLVAEQYEQTLPLLLYITIAGIGTMCFPHSFIWVNFHQKDWGVRVPRPCWDPTSVSNNGPYDAGTEGYQPSGLPKEVQRRCWGFGILVKGIFPSDQEVGRLKSEGVFKNHGECEYRCETFVKILQWDLREFKL